MGFALGMAVGAIAAYLLLRLWWMPPEVEERAAELAAETDDRYVGWLRRRYFHDEGVGQ